MDQKSGSKSVQPPENQGESSNSDSPITAMAGGVPLVVGSFSIDDAIAMHLVDCVQCRHAIEDLKPKAIGQKTGLCDTYLHLQLMRAQYEGRVNNIVAHTELGDEAPKGRPLE